MPGHLLQGTQLSVELIVTGSQWGKSLIFSVCLLLLKLPSQPSVVKFVCFHILKGEMYFCKLNWFHHKRSTLHTLITDPLTPTFIMSKLFVVVTCLPEIRGICFLIKIPLTLWLFLTGSFAVVYYWEGVKTLTFGFALSVHLCTGALNLGHAARLLKFTLCIHLYSL